MIMESSHRAVCDALNRAIVERDKFKAEHAAARAEADRLRAAIEEVLEFVVHGGHTLRAMVGLRQALDAGTAAGRAFKVEDIDALREAGGNAWDRVEDVEDYLGRKDG